MSRKNRRRAPEQQREVGQPALAVPKPGSDKLRFASDSRGVKKLTVPVASAMPDMDSLVQSVVGSEVFAQIDLCHAYWQLALHILSQDIMPIRTPIGVFRQHGYFKAQPTRATISRPSPRWHSR